MWDRLFGHIYKKPHISRGVTSRVIEISKWLKDDRRINIVQLALERNSASWIVDARINETKAVFAFNVRFVG